MASTALLYFMHYELGYDDYPYFPSQSPSAHSTSDLKLSGFWDVNPFDITLNNASLAILVHQKYLQYWRHSYATFDFHQYIYMLGNLTLSKPVVLIIRDNASPRNYHAVVAYKVVPDPIVNGIFDGKVKIYLYDPNYHQDSSRYAIYDLAQGSFSYEGYCSFNVVNPTAMLPDPSLQLDPYPPAFISGNDWLSWGITNYYLVMSSKHITLRTQDGLEDYFMPPWNSQTFVKGIPDSAGIMEGGVQIYAYSDKLQCYIQDPSSNQSTMIITHVMNESGKLIEYGYILNASTAQGSLNFTITPSNPSLSIIAGDKALNVSIIFLVVTQLDYSISQTPSLQVNPGQTLNLTCPLASILMDVTASRSVVSQGYNPVINITITNIDSYSEMYNVYVYANDTIIGTFANITLPNNSTTTLTLNWNTTGFTYGNYILNAFIEKASEKAIVSFNVKGYMVKVTILGDVNGDGKVDLKDVFAVALAYGSYPGHPKWNPNLDINNDNQIDLKDYMTTALNYGKTNP
jgi:hypothetical protein